MTLPFVVGINGYAQAGKDTAATVFINEFGYKRLAFADLIRNFLYEQNARVLTTTGMAIPLQEYIRQNGWEKAKQNPHVRKLMQDTGQGLKKVFGQEVFNTAVADQMSYDKGPYVITDVRFPHEVKFIDKEEGICIRIVNPKITKPPFDHASETSYTDENWDRFVIVNDNTPEFHNRVRSFISKWQYLESTSPIVV